MVVMYRKKITCPFCFERFPASAVDFRCGNPGCTKEPDPLFDAKHHPNITTPPLRGHTFTPSQTWWQSLRMPLKAECDLCHEKTRKRLCPGCHFELSHDAGLIDERNIAIIGARATGKGHYLATLIHCLEHEVGGQFGFSLLMMGDETRQRFEDDYRSPLLKRHQLLQPTVSAQTDSRTKSPLVFRLTQPGKWAIKLSFFDAAGEDMQNLEVLSTEARYITGADGIIFLLDSAQIDAIRDSLKDALLPMRDIKADPVHIIERLIELFERYQERTTFTNQVIKTPVAFTLAKTDILDTILPLDSVLRRTGRHSGYFDLIDAQSLHTEIQAHLETWLGGGLCQRVKTGFTRYRYFGVSALGEMPDATGKIRSVSSRRVEDPLLWLLYEMGLIKGKKRN